MHWIYLIFAICFEVMGTLSLKYSTIYPNKWWTAGIVVFYIASFSFVWMAIKVIDIGIAYAIWAGVGTALIAVLGWLVFKEEMSLVKAIFIAMIVVGAAGLHFVSEHAEAAL